MQDTIASWKMKVIPLVAMLGVMWAVEVINIFTGHAFDSLGILPRTLSGLIGIPLAPFLHGGLFHILANSIPFLVLGFMVSLTGATRFSIVTVGVIIIGGLLTWLMARSSYHIGASGLVFGYFGYLLAAGWFERSPKTIALAVVTVFLYGGLIWGILPSVRRVSFEGHLFGMIAGIAIAWAIARGNRGTSQIE